MYANIIHDSPAEHRRLWFAGIANLVVISLMIWFCIALYDKKFTNSTDVTVMADRAGLQLARFGDVRMHGALVGYVKKIESDGKEAEITLSLRPAAARTIPRDVSVQILPTTLFGQNYLELVPPKSGTSAATLRDGTVIPSKRVTTNVDLQAILANLFPLLRSVRPADLNATLYAIAHALQGKGDQLGDTFETLDDYLNRMNVELPTLRSDLQLLSQVSKTYELAAPDLIRLLRNATVTARTITDKQGTLDRALGSLTGLARTTRVTLSENEKQLIAQTRSARPLLALLDTYSPELSCVIVGLDRQIPNAKNVFNDGIIHQTLELGAPQRTAYTAADAPEYGEVGHGPWCLGLPDNYDKPAPFQPLKDGSDKDDPDGGI
ncbi:MAG: phospholipid/cholesterol/gamma-HCH transport system substrate-binding protein, partial [Nocardioidaceae bacterium]|nr:phospholipid/cholesterol/gamma-HCH transport system substrate-binding protein [Nocardioidaceae bacterium]